LIDIESVPSVDPAEAARSASLPASVIVDN
jgi:hypothetical protein